MTDRAAEYAVCQQRGHQAGAFVGASVYYPGGEPQWDTCRWCGTRYRFERVMHEADAPVSPPPELDPDGLDIRAWPDPPDVAVRVTHRPSGEFCTWVAATEQEAREKATEAVRRWVDDPDATFDPGPYASPRLLEALEADRQERIAARDAEGDGP